MVRGKFGESSVDENLIEWIPELLGSGVCCIDQLTQWLIDAINISPIWLIGWLVDWFALMQRAESHEMQKSAAVEH